MCVRGCINLYGARVLSIFQWCNVYETYLPSNQHTNPNLTIYLPLYISTLTVNSTGEDKIGIMYNWLEIYLEFGAAHNSIGSVVTLSNESPQQSTIMIIISTMITGIGCFAQNIPHLKAI